MRHVLPLALISAALVASPATSRADWRDPIAGASPVVPASVEPGQIPLTVHISPARKDPAQDGGASFRWSQPLVDRRLDPSQRIAPLDVSLVDAVKRIEPIYDPTRLQGPFEVEPMRIFAGTAETRDIFGDHWRIASADANVDADVRSIAAAWTAGSTPRPCDAYRIRRPHGWGEAALSAPTAADCRAIRTRQARGFADVSPLPVAIAAPPIPVFAAPEPGSRMSSADFWAAQRTRIAGIHDHLDRKWVRRSRAALKSASK